MLILLNSLVFFTVFAACGAATTNGGEEGLSGGLSPFLNYNLQSKKDIYKKFRNIKKIYRERNDSGNDGHSGDGRGGFHRKPHSCRTFTGRTYCNCY